MTSLAKEDIRKMTKLAVARWSDRDVKDVRMTDKLNDLRPGAKAQLRQPVNDEFAYEHGFPIPPADWQAGSFKTVGELRDFNASRLEG